MADAPKTFEEWWQMVGMPTTAMRRDAFEPVWNAAIAAVVAELGFQASDWGKNHQPHEAAVCEGCAARIAKLAISEAK